MSDYLQFTFDKSRIPDIPTELSEKIKEYAQRQMRYIPLPDPYAPSMSFERFKEILGKDRSIMSIDEPTRFRPKIVGSINPAEEPIWIKEFKKWLTLTT